MQIEVEIAGVRHVAEYVDTTKMPFRYATGDVSAGGGAMDDGDRQDRQAAWYRAVRDGTPRGRHYGAPLEEDPPVDVAEIEAEPDPVRWTDAGEDRGRPDG